MKERIIKILERYVHDEIGETRPYIDPDFIEQIAEEIVIDTILATQQRMARDRKES